MESVVAEDFLRGRVGDFLTPVGRVVPNRVFFASRGYGVFSRVDSSVLPDIVAEQCHFTWIPPVALWPLLTQWESWNFLHGRRSRLRSSMDLMAVFLSAVVSYITVVVSGVGEVSGAVASWAWAVGRVVVVTLTVVDSGICTPLSMVRET